MRSNYQNKRSRYGTDNPYGGRRWGNRDYNYGSSRAFGYNSADRDRYEYDEPYGHDYGYGDSYQRNVRGLSGDHSRPRYRNDDRNLFDRAGDRIRETWDNWTENEGNGRGGYRSYGNGNGRDGGNIFNRAGKRIREQWDDWTDRDDYDHRRYNDEYGADSYHRRNHGYAGNTNDHRGGRWNRWYDGEGRNQGDYGHSGHQHRKHSHDNNHRHRNVFRKAADKIREQWNEWTGHDNERDNEYRYRSEGRNRYSGREGYSNRNYRHNWRNRNKKFSW